MFINVIIRPLEYTATCFGPHFRHIHFNISQKVKINTINIGLKKDLNVSRNMLPRSSTDINKQSCLWELRTDV